jgi:hypothetical protein
VATRQASVNFWLWCDVPFFCQGNRCKWVLWGCHRSPSSTWRWQCGLVKEEWQ